jgi:hypothetical protein
MQRQGDSLNAGLQPFAAKLSANPLKALEAKRGERLPLFFPPALPCSGDMSKLK